MDLVAKLQLRPGQHLVRVQVPDELAASLPQGDTDGDATVESALIVFVADRSDLEAHRAPIVRSARDDRLTWVSYPKSGQLGTDLNRDGLAGWLAENDVQPVRQISLNDVWTALRVRPA